MGWKDWDRTNKVVVGVCAVVVVAVIATFAVLALRPEGATPPPPPTTPGTSQSSPTPSPSYECTTASGPDCTKDLADKEAARAKAYSDAEGRLRGYHSLLTKLRKDGGVNELPPAFEEFATEKYQEGIQLGLESIKIQDLYYSGEFPHYEH